MYVPRTGRWADALRQTLNRVHDPTTRTPVPWLLSGEAALAVQGVNVEPEIIEFRAISQYAVAYFAQFMKPYEAPANTATIVYRRGGNLPPSEHWRSNIHQRVVGWSVGGTARWLGRWHVAGTIVQVCYIKSIHPDPITLSLRAPVRRAHFAGAEVAVVPFEYLLADSALRGQAGLTPRILHAMRTGGYDLQQLRKAVDVLPSDKGSRLLRSLEFSLVAG